MDYVIQLISNVGFPIAACLCMGVFCNKLISDIKTTVDKNTEVLNRIMNKLDGD